MNGEGIMSVPPAILKPLTCCTCQKVFNRRNDQRCRSVKAYLLNCGHSVCEWCCQNVITNVIYCGVCGSHTQLISVNNITSTLPRNAYLEGRITLRKNILMMDKILYKRAMKQDKETCQTNIGLNPEQNPCYECSKTDATKACQQCECNYCDPCWTKVHSSGKSLQKHVPVTKNSFNWNNTTSCNVHKGKVVEFYCRQCNVYACPNCAVVNHQGENHKPVSLQERNTELFEDVEQLKREANLNLKRMVVTMTELKELREKVPCRDASYEDLQRQVINNFVHLHGVLQLAEESVLKRLEEAENAKRDRLEEILLQLDRQIEITREVLRRIENMNDPEKLKKDILFERILDTLTTLKNLPSRLVKSEDPGNEDRSNEKPTVSFDDNIVERLKNYCTLNIPITDVLELKSNADDVDSHFSGDSEVEHVDGQHTMVNEGDAESKNSDVCDDSKKLIVKTYEIKSSNRPLSVLPMPKTKPMNMVEGKAYPVYISYVKDPEEFYVIRSCLRNRRRNIDVLAPTLAAREQSPPKCIQKDEYYLVQYAADKKWYRGRVIDVLPQKDENNETVALIYYLDYGNKQEVPLSRMRDMPMHLREEPPLAVKCKLFSYVPRKGSTKVMLEVLNESVMTMYVKKVLPDCLEVDLCRRGSDVSLDRELISLCDMIVFPEFASSAARDTDRKKRVCVRYPTSVGPDVEDSFLGFITYVETSSMFYMQKMDRETLSLAEMLDSTYSKGNMKGLIYNTDLEMPCAALYPEDGKWYRGEIIDFPGQEQLTVRYVDYGNKETVHWKSVRRLKPEFLKLVPQAIPCSLADVPQMVNSKWRPDVKDRLGSYSTEVLKVFVVDKKVGKLNVVLYTNKNVCINEEMLESVTEKKESQDCGEVHPTIVEDCSVTGNEKNLKNKKGPEKEESLENSPDEVFRTEVTVLRVSSPSDIYVSLPCFSSRVEELEKELQEFYTNSEPETEAEWQLNDRCAALSCKREKWYRATISEIVDEDSIRVMFKDIMETEDVPVSNIRKLDERFFSYPIGAIKCHLSGIFPPETEWPGLTCDFLKSQLDSYQNVYMTKMGEIENNSLPIQLWVKKRTQGGALEPTTGKWVVLNDLIVEQGLAVPEKAKLLQHIVNEEGIKPAGKVDSKTFQVIGGISDVSCETGSSFIPSAATDWPPPKPCRKDSFVGEPMHVDSDGVIYIQDNEDKSILDQIRVSLLEYYDNSKPQAHDQSWSEGQVCIVRYYLDGGWYRGKVLKVNENLTYDVLFVDYGNTETCTVTEMRKEIKHLDVPVLARRYVLHGVTPASDDGKWPSQVIDYIYSSLVEKCCDVRIMEQSTDVSKPIKVKIKMRANDFDISEDLVNLKLAYFDSDGKPGESAGKGSQEAISEEPAGNLYSRLKLPENLKSFPIEVLIIKYSDFFVHIADHGSIPEEIRKVISDFLSLTDEIQRVAESQGKLEDFREGAPCISLYSHNGTWYRAEVVHLDNQGGLVFVRYVDYGNEEYVTKDRIRQCLTKWFNFPRMALKCRLFNVRMCKGVKAEDYMAALTNCLAQPGLTAEVVQGNETAYVVEVKHDGVLAYQEMIDNGLMEFAGSSDPVTADLD